MGGEPLSAPPRVLLLMPSSTYHAADFVAAAERLGVAVTVGTDGSQALQELVPGSSLTLRFEDIKGATTEIAAFHERFPLAAVVASDDQATALAAAAGAALGLPHNPITAVQPTRSKRALRAALHKAGLPSPRHAVIDLRPAFVAAEEPERAERIEAALRAWAQDALPYPVVLKPTFLSASRGVIRADDDVAFDAAVRRIGAILHEEWAAGGGHVESHLILVEEYLPGAEYAVEAMLRGGKLHVLALFDKPDPLEGPYFEETIYVTPSRGAAALQERIVAATRAAVGALGLREGPVHAELRVNERGAFVIDLAARAIGGLCPRVLRFGTGASLEELILRHALGDDFASFAREPGGAGVMMIPIPRAGVLRGVRGLEAARSVAGIREVTLTINPGQRLVPLPEGNRYLGFIFAHAITPADAESTLRQAHALLNFDIEPRD